MIKQIRRPVVLLICVLGLLATHREIARANPEGDGASLVGAMPPLKKTFHSLPVWEKRFPAFSHAPFESAGFNALMLPFIFSSPDQSADPAVTYAFSFLFSGDLDWAPGSYCARHAFFVFRRDRELMQPMARHYEASQIAELIDGWKVTHAIGGRLIATKAAHPPRLGAQRCTGPARAIRASCRSGHCRPPDRLTLHPRSNGCTGANRSNMVVSGGRL